MKRLIFIEGVSGVGKSVTVRKLGDELRILRYAVKCHYEGDFDCPLSLCRTAYLEISEYEKILTSYSEFADIIYENIIYKGDYVLLRYQIGRTNLYPQELQDELQKCELCYNPINCTVPLSKFTQVFADLWNKFASSDNADCDYEIFDAALVSHMTNDLIRNYNVSVNELVSHLETLLQIIRCMNPAIVYLSAENVRERLIKARSSRNQSPGDDDKIAFWEKRKQMDLAVLPKLSVDVQMINIVNDKWDSVVSYIISRI